MDTQLTQRTIPEILEIFETSADGLSSKKAKEKRKKSAYEIKSQGIPLFKILLQQYGNFLMLLLIFGAALSIYLGQLIDGLVIVVILVFNGLLGTFQEYRAEKLTQALTAHIPQQVTVRRDGTESVIDRRDLVLGDLVILTGGQLVPADLRIVKNFGLIADEATLTGESVGVIKQAEELADEPKGVHEMLNMVFSGTVVLEGGCEGVVTAVGGATQFGKIISFARGAKKRSSFLQQVNELSDFLFKATVIISAVLFIALAFYKPDFTINEIFLFAIALAIAIVPEMLPLMSTIALTKASLALIKNGVLIKRLSSLEDLGGIEVICADKTGTLTHNVLTVTDVIAENERSCFRTALMASKEIADSNFILAGSFDAAIWKKANDDLKTSVRSRQTIWSGSFDPRFRWQFNVIKENDAASLAVKGAPESILPRCDLNPSRRQDILSAAEEFGKKGLRVLVVAERPVSSKNAYDQSDISVMTYAGMLVFEDPIKESAAPALARAERLGIRIKILTGDSPEVALQVARAAGMEVAEREVVTGHQFSKADAEGKSAMSDTAKIFARISPQEKFEIIQWLEKKRSVMFLGEGINDAPALKTADVGMVVQEASDIAKETADIILTKPDLGVIIQSIYLGRQIMNNIAKYILITLTGNFGSLYAISLISLISPILPLLPTQVLLENILTDVPMVGLVNSPVSGSDLSRPFRQRVRRICFNASILGAATLIVQFIFYRMFDSLPADLFRTLWLMEIILFEYALIVSLQTADWFWKNMRTAGKAVKEILIGSGIVVGTLLLPFLPFVNSWFHLQPYPFGYLLPIGLTILLGLIIVEVTKRFLIPRTM